MKWIGERISFHEKNDISTFVIYPERKAWALSLMGAWCAMWLTIGIVMTWAFFTLKLTESEQIIVVVFMSFWLYYAQRVGRSFLWMLWGKEMLKINLTELTYKKAIRSYGKAQPYFHENISKIRLSIPEENSIQSVWENSPWVVGGERIEFDYLGKVIRLGRKINEKDAKLLFQILVKRVETFQRKRAKSSTETIA
ncbi:MAG: hypothetical protein KJ941_11515 [Bacteroidetes bacterium]|nr:hypothetical protein [Bacteroidota bacterium]